MTVIRLQDREGNEEDSAPGAAGGPVNAVEIRGLTKIYKGTGELPPKQALKGVDLDIPRGAVFGLLGPNGAGKSTIINIMAGLVNKTSGTVRIWDYDIDRDRRTAKNAIGVVPQELNIDPHFTPKHLLDQQSALYGLKPSEYRTWEVLEVVGLTEEDHAYARWLSGGMKRRLLIAKAMLHSPPVVVLDEPTAGVDVELRQHLWAYMKELNGAGITILLTTHYLEEAEKLCDFIAIIDAGEVIARERTGDLLRRIDSKEMTVTLTDDLEAVPYALGKFDVELLPPRRLHFRFRRTETQIGEIIAAIQGAGMVIADLTTSEGRLEDVFLELTRGRAKPADADDAS